MDVFENFMVFNCRGPTWYRQFFTLHFDLCKKPHSQKPFTTTATTILYKAERRAEEIKNIQQGHNEKMLLLLICFLFIVLFHIPFQYGKLYASIALVFA